MPWYMGAFAGALGAIIALAVVCWVCGRSFMETPTYLAIAVATFWGVYVRRWYWGEGAMQYCTFTLGCSRHTVYKALGQVEASTREKMPA